MNAKDSIFNLDYHYTKELPHLESWSKGQKVATCKSFVKKINKEKTIISLKGLPSSKNRDIYVRYWAAKSNPQDWNTFKDAYDEFKNEYEEMPNKDYENGGSAKISAAGIAKLYLDIPKGYKSGHYLIKPHFHYRLCIDGNMGPVHTQYINKKNKIITHKKD
jgi:hypothetical protein